MEKFAKIIEVDNKQVVVMRRSDHDNNEHVHVVVSFDGFSAEPKLGYGDDDQAADEAFEAFGEEEARNIIKSINELLN